jgi:6-phosphogluconolactonase
MKRNQSTSVARGGASPTDRRGFIKDAAAAGVALMSMPRSVEATGVGRRQTVYRAYVSLQDDDRISIFTVDPATGTLARQEDVAVDGGPAPLAIDPSRNFLYVGRRGSQEISSYRIDQRTGGLSLIGSTPLQGEPVYVATDRTGRFVLSAYYYQSTAAVHAVNSDGVATFPPVEWQFTGGGAHAILTDRSNRFAFVPHIANRGPNAIFQFRFDENTGQLIPNDPPRYSPREYLGPRALAFHPTLDTVYFSDEQGSSVTAYQLDPSAGTLAPFQTISTLPAGYRDANTCSQIQIAPSGRFLYAPNRGHNSVASFGVDASTGRLTATGRVPTEPVPRAFSLDPDGSFLFVAGLESGRLASYRVDPESGELTPLETCDAGNRPMWVLITALPGG